ncbi:DUF1385 domain-containing protein [bacterium]|nr:DUF1385 domain-containing protein [bacterium]
MKDDKINVGGQAVIEGVMMRSPKRVVTAVRRPDGVIVTQANDYISLAKRYKILNLPLVRGTINLFEMLIIGIKSLNWSAEVAMEEEKTSEIPPDIDEDKQAPSTPHKSKGTTLSLVFALVIGLGMGLLLFFLLPITLTSLLGFSKEALTFNLFAGLFRMIIFLLYLFIISRLKDIKRIFEYHGAEHKSVFAFEHGKELTVEGTRQFSTHHPRCGTSFIIIVALLAILIFSVTDILFAHLFGHPPNIIQRFGWHLLFLPLVAGLSYEWLKLSGKAITRKNIVIRWLSAPGLWLQNITTIEPSDDQIEVALTALKEALK